MTEDNQSEETCASPPTKPMAPARVGALQTQLLAYLRENKSESAGVCFERLVEVPGWVDQGFHLLHSLIRAEPDSQRVEMSLLTMLLQRSDVSFKYIRFIAIIIAIAVTCEQEGAIFERLSALIEDESAPAPRFSNLNFISHISNPGPKYGRLLAKLKYKGTRRFDPDDVLSIAGDLAHRLDLPPNLEERLYATTLFSQTPRREWTAQVKQAFAIDTVLADRLALFSLFRNDVGSSWKVRLTATNALVDTQEIKRGFKYFNPALGTLVTTFHGGFINLIVDAFVQGAKNGMVMAHVGGKQLLATHGANLISTVDPKAALFRGVRSILDGQSILIAADARTGKCSSSIRVLDVDVPVADGAPFIAYETNCETIWLGVERSRNGFAPVFVQGPSRREGERFVEFRERWLSFYSYQLNRFLIGSPQDLTLRMQWAAIFSKRLDANQIVA